MWSVFLHCPSKFALKRNHLLSCVNNTKTWTVFKASKVVVCFYFHIPHRTLLIKIFSKIWNICLRAGIVLYELWYTYPLTRWVYGLTEYIYTQLDYWKRIMHLIANFTCSHHCKTTKMHGEYFSNDWL